MIVDLGAYFRGGEDDIWRKYGSNHAVSTMSSLPRCGHQYMDGQFLKGPSYSFSSLVS